MAFNLLLFALVVFARPSFAAGLNPSREVVVSPSTLSSLDFLSDSADIDGRTLIAKGWSASESKHVAVVFDRHLGGPDRWNPQAMLSLPGTPDISDLAIDGDIAVVSSVFDDTYGVGAGSVHLFYRNYPTSSRWGLWKTLVPSGAATNGLGWRVAIDGDFLAVSTSGPGGVFLYGRNAGGADHWGLVKSIAAGAPSKASVGLHRGLLAVGSSSENKVYLYGQNEGGADNWGEAAQLAPSDNASNLFGFDVAVWGDTVVVGAYGDSDGGSYAGAAYVYSRNENGANQWGETGKIMADDAAAGQGFARSVGIWNDTIIASADGDSEMALGGAAYVFSRNRGGADQWGQTTKLTSPAAMNLSVPLPRGVAIDSGVAVAAVQHNGAGGAVNGVRVFEEYPCFEWDDFENATVLTDTNSPALSNFGTAVSLYGDRLAVGSGSSINADGQVYIYERNREGKDAWGLAWKSGLDLVPGSRFGAAVSLDGDLLAVASPDGYDQFYNQANTGYVRLFAPNSASTNSWVELAYLAPANGNALDRFGSAVELQRDWLFVGVPGDDSLGTDEGAVEIYHRNQGGMDVWGHVQTLLPTNPAVLHAFGGALSADNGRLVVGDLAEKPNGVAEEKVSVFEQNAGGLNQWGIVRTIEFPLSDPLYPAALFGKAVSLSGDTLAVGAPGYDIPESQAGAVYVFERNRGGDGEWGQVAQLLPGDALATPNGQFGFSVSLFGDFLCVGMPEGTNASVFVYGRNEGGENHWGLLETYAGSPGTGNRVGGAVSLFGRRIAVGEPRKVLGRVHVLDPACNRVTTFSDVVANDGKTSLREAINLANACTNGTFTIYLADGAYSLSLTGADEDANASGDLDISNPACTIAIRGQGARRTRILGVDDRIFHITSTVELYDLSLIDGAAPGGAPGTGGANGQFGQSGGAILNHGNLTITRCALVGNSAGDGGDAQAGQGTFGGGGGKGGGVFNTGTLTVYASTFDHNEAGKGGAGDTSELPGDGGGIFNGTGGELLVVNSTFSGNKAGEDSILPGLDRGGNGGGIYSDSGAASIGLRFNSFRDNTAGRFFFINGKGGGVYAGGTIQPFNYNVMEENEGFVSSNIFATVHNPRYNIIDGIAGLTISGTSTSNLVAQGILRPLGFKHGQTDTCEPYSGSPAIDFIPASLGGIPEFDQRGALRPTSGVTVDAGAVEATGADFDGDGYSDLYEQLYNMDPESPTTLPGDADGDGADSQSEYIALTAWNDPASLFRIIQIDSQTNHIDISFTTEGGRAYLLQSTIDPASGTWMYVGGYAYESDNDGIMTLTDTNAAPHKLYRVNVSIP